MVQQLRIDTIAIFIFLTTGLPHYNEANMRTFIIRSKRQI